MPTLVALHLLIHQSPVGKSAALATQCVHHARLVQILTKVSATSVGIAGTGMTMSLKTRMRKWTRIVMLCTKIMIGMMKKSDAFMVQARSHDVLLEVTEGAGTAARVTAGT